MAPTLEFYYYDFCPFCVRVKKTIKKLNIKVTYCNTMEDPSCEQKLFTDTGRRTVPCLYIDNIPMHESSEIISWLQDNQKKT